MTDLRELPHDRRNPNHFQAMYLDQSLPIDDQAKLALLEDARTWSRQFFLPFVRPFARLTIVLLQLIKVVVPNAFTSSGVLHALLCWGLRRWVSPHANLLILRHMHIGSEILGFIRCNSGIDVPANPLRPRTIEDLRDDVFLKHDLNLYNFVIDLNRGLRAEGRKLAPPARLDFSAITDGPFPIDAMPSRWTNFLDLETAIELFTPLYQLFLTDGDFWRAANSLQLDETIGIYAATLLQTPWNLSLVNNKHPLVPLSTLRAGHRLMLHGLSAETLHAMLREHKRAQAAAVASSPDDDRGVPRPATVVA